MKTLLAILLLSSLAFGQAALSGTATLSGTAKLGAAAGGATSTCGSTAAVSGNNGGGDNGSVNGNVSCTTGANVAGYDVTSFVVSANGGAGSANLICGIYATSTGVPTGTPLCSTSATVLTSGGASPSDVTMTMTSCSLAASTTYYLGCNTDVTGTLYGTNGSSLAVYYRVYTYPDLGDMTGPSTGGTADFRRFLNLTAK